MQFKPNLDHTDTSSPILQQLLRWWQKLSVCDQQILLNVNEKICFFYQPFEDYSKALAKVLCWCNFSPLDHYLVHMCVRRQTGHWLGQEMAGVCRHRSGSWASLINLLQSQTRKEAVQAAGTGGRRYRSSIGTGVQPPPTIDQDHNQSGKHWAAWSKNRVKKHLRASSE